MSEDKKPRLSPHPIVARLADDPSSPREVVTLAGYIGKSTRADHHRVYLSLDLREYIDVPDAAIVHFEDIPATEMECGGTRLWIEASAQVVRETRQTTRTEARFLEGAIADEHLQEARAAGFGRAARAAEDDFPPSFGCPPPTHFPECAFSRVGATCQETCPPCGFDPSTAITCELTCGFSCPPQTCGITCAVTCGVRSCVALCDPTPGCPLETAVCEFDPRAAMPRRRVAPVGFPVHFRAAYTRWRWRGRRGGGFDPRGG